MTSLELDAYLAQEAASDGYAGGAGAELSGPGVSPGEAKDMGSSGERRARLEVDDATPSRRGWLAAPLTQADGSNMGCIELSDKTAGDFTSDDEAILVQLAQLASIAIRNCLEAEAREANRLKDEFLATLSHELRTPLNAILGWTQMLRANSRDPAKLNRGLEVIERNARVQTTLIEELLDVSRITSGTFHMSTRAIPMGPVIDAAIDAVRPAADAKSIRLESVALAESPPWVLGDPDRLQQALLNLLSNAIKFSHDGGRVQVRVARVEGEVELSVIDEGKGIAADFLPFIFERFRQADSTTVRSEGGLGIGLAVVRHIVELHGGSVGACSEGEGRGTTIRLRLPGAANGEPSQGKPPSEEKQSAKRESPPESAEAPPTLRGIHVLVVEDNPDARELMADALARHDAEVTAVGWRPRLSLRLTSADPTSW